MLEPINRTLAILLLTILTFFSAAPTYAHPGRMDKNGCHHNRKTGNYHCHRGSIKSTPKVTKNPKIIQGVASVIDGDTIEIHGVRIRLFGIDAPESKQICKTAGGSSFRCGRSAANGLAALIGRQTVSCTVKDTDKYGRSVSICRVGGTDVGSYLVSHGLAVAYRQYSKMYVSEEDNANHAHVGVWSGAFQMPWDWRHAH